MAKKLGVEGPKQILFDSQNNNTYHNFSDSKAKPYNPFDDFELGVSDVHLQKPIDQQAAGHQARSLEENILFANSEEIDFRPKAVIIYKILRKNWDTCFRIVFRKLKYHYSTALNIKRSVH